MQLLIPFTCLTVSEVDDEVWSEKSSHGSDTDTNSNNEEEAPPDDASTQVNDTTASSSKLCISLKDWILAFFLLLQARFHVPNRIMDAIFKFLKTMFILIGHVSSVCALIGKALPGSCYHAQKLYTKAMQTPRFTKYTVCKKCGFVWSLEECFEGYGAYKKPKLCSNIPL